jgi:hypothetical protein
MPLVETLHLLFRDPVRGPDAAAAGGGGRLQPAADPGRLLGVRQGESTGLQRLGLPHTGISVFSNLKLLSNLKTKTKVLLN